MLSFQTLHKHFDQGFQFSLNDIQNVYYYDRMNEVIIYCKDGKAYEMNMEYPCTIKASKISKKIAEAVFISQRYSENSEALLNIIDNSKS